MKLSKEILKYPNYNKIAYRASILSLFILTFGLMSCVESKTEIHELLENDNTRIEIFNKIASNYEYMEGMNNAMIENGSAIQIFEDNPDMVNHLINNDGMVDLLKNNPQAKQHMMALMLKDSLFNSQLIEKAIQDENNTSKMINQLETNNILPKDCATMANKEVVKKFGVTKPQMNK